MRARDPLVFAAVFMGVASCRAPRTTTSQPQQAAPPPISAVQRDNDETMGAVLASIAGREQEPAGQVFKNVKWLTNTSAKTFLSIMNGGYAKALGVRCSHCHVRGNFASDELRPKRAAREMAVMHRMINQELAKMQDIATPPTANRAISCITCHRGMVDPRADR
jgi:hypothetical protein